MGLFPVGMINKKYCHVQALFGRKGDLQMREWTKEEKYRYLKDPQELGELYEKISASV